MKLLHNQKVVGNINALIDSYTQRSDPPIEVKDVNKIYKHKTRTGQEMQLTV